MSDSPVLGKWYNFSDFSFKEWKQAGLPISPSVLCNGESQICFPVHMSPRVVIHASVRVDRYVYINCDSILYPNVYIGSYSSLARNVQVGVANHPADWLSTHSFQYSSDLFKDIGEYHQVDRTKRHLHHANTKIGSDVWLGANVLVKSGVTIGHGVIVAAGSVVVKDVPAYAIVGGVPAKLIRYRFDEKIRERLLQSKWWTLSLSDLKTVSFDQIDTALEQIERIVASAR